MVDPQNITGVNQHPEPLSPRNRNRVPKLSTTNRSHSVKYEPDSDTDGDETGCAMNVRSTHRRRRIEPKGPLTSGFPGREGGIRTRGLSVPNAAR